MHNSNWDNLRFVLAVIDEGSVSAAARLLEVNHATVLRRIAAFEAQNGGPIFDKTANGYRILPDKARLIEAMRDVENGVLSVQRLMQGAHPNLSGVVRVASTDTICLAVLPKLLAGVQKASPDLEIELLSNNSHLDFARMQADIFVRPSVSLPENTSGDVAANLVFRAYATDTRSDRWLGLKGPLANSVAARWLSENVPQSARVSGSDSFLVLAELARMGAGIAILPSFIGGRIAELRPLGDVMPDISVPIWVGSHEDLRLTPRIRAVKKHIAKLLADMTD